MEEEKKEFLKLTQRDECGFRQDCSQIIDILQEIGGNEEYIRSFGVEYHYGVRCKDMLKTMNNSKSHVIFTPSGRRHQLGDVSSGHFHFINKDDWRCKDSYTLKWQNDGSNGFCQTFALMGALGRDKDFVGKSKEECSMIACKFILSNNKHWFKKYWKKLCKDKGYVNLESLTELEINEDIEMCMLWKNKKSTMFWNLVIDENVYV